MYSKKLRHFIKKAAVLAAAAVLALSCPYAAYAESTAENTAVESGTEAASSAESVTPTPEPTPPPADIMPTNGVEGWPKSLDTDGDYICLMDADTGAVLLEKGMNTQTPPASLTKIMTCLLALENGGDLTGQITMDETGVEYAVTGSSSLYTQVGEVFTLKDALYGVMLKSANDLATQVGKYIGGGDLDTFIQMMNDRAKEIGCTGTNFVNACGMPADGHVSTAHDMALIFSEALKNDTFREIIHTHIYTIPATNMTEPRIIENHQPFISNPEWNTYEGIIGGKTGYTDLAGSCLVTGCEQNGMTLTAVTMHCSGSLGFEQDTKQMLDFGFDNFKKADVGSGDEGLLSGGYVTIPNDASAKECTYEDSENTSEDGSSTVTRVYLWNGREVGTSVYEADVPAVKTADSGTSSYADSSASGSAVSSGTVSGSEEVSAPASPSESETLSAPAENSEDRVDVLGVSMSRRGVLVLTVMVVLVLVGIILIIILSLLRGRRNRRRR